MHHAEGSDQRCWLRLRDGRRMAYTVTGPDGGTPVVYCHGAIGTPLEATVDLEQMTQRLGIRYIAPSRPGIGGSDAQPGRTVLDFADDLRQLADALTLERFSLVGVSAGGPYALAAAHRMPARVHRAAVCSSLSPLWAPHRTPGVSRRIALGLALLHRLPRTSTALGDTVLPVIAAHPYLLTKVIAANAARSERARLATAGERDAASRSFLDAASGSVGGMIDDFIVYSREWGFRVQEIEADVQLWHGAADPLVPVEHALQLSASLPRCRVYIDPDEGHHFFRSRLESILAALTRVEPLEQREHRRRRLQVARAARRAVAVADPDLQVRTAGDADPPAADLRDRLAG
jgi:pimeloyl-ACP methyl ester carboxylesterase